MDFTTDGRILQDTKNGKERPWVKNKIKSQLLAASFMRLDMEKRSNRVMNCSSFLKFAECVNDDYKKLTDANFCRDRMCPTCNLRRSRKLQQQILNILCEAHRRLDGKLRFVLLGLTVRNVPGEELSGAVTKMLRGFMELFKLGEVDEPTIGYIRTLEVTYNVKDDTYHPHIHCLMAVKPSYFKGKCYITQARWAELWQRLLKLDYEPVVHVKAVKPRSAGQVPIEAAFEVGKYCGKSTDYIIPGNPERSDKVTKHISEGIKGRRLIGFGKLFRQIHKELNLDDLENKDAELIKGNEHNCTCPICSSTLLEIIYKWHYGYSLYLGSD